MFQGDFQFPEDFNENILSVVIMADSFFYGIFDNEHTLLCHKSYKNIRFSNTFDIEALLNDPNLQLNFQKILVLAHTNDSVHTQSRDDSFLTLLPGLTLKSKKMEKLSGVEIYNYFGISPHQEDLLNRLFGYQNYILRSESALLSSYYLGNFEDFMHVHVDSSTLVIYVQKEGKMVFYNTFVTHGINDVIYFILAVCDLINLNPESVGVKISGWLEKDSHLYKNLHSYVGRIELADASQFKIIQSNTSQIKTHFYFLHFINISCAL